MIELKNIKISTKNDDTSFDESFNNGIHYLDYEKEKLFRFLLLKDQFVEDGTFLINEWQFFPRDILNKQALTALKINSAVIDVVITFISSKKEQKKTLEDLQNGLFTLKDLPLESDEEKEFKIRRIFEIIKNFNIGYVMLDLNDDVNIVHRKLIEKIVAEFQQNLTIIILNRAPLLALAPVDDINVTVESSGSESSSCGVDNQLNESDSSVQAEIKDEVVKRNKKKFKDYLAVKILKDFTSSYILIALECLFSIFALLLCPYFFNNDNIAWGIVLIIISVFGIFANLLFSFSNEKFLLKRYFNEPKANYINVIFLTLFNLIGAGLAYLLVFIFKTFNMVIESEKYISSFYIPSIIVASLIIIFAILSPYIYRFVIFFQNKFKKLKHK